MRLRSIPKCAQRLPCNWLGVDPGRSSGSISLLPLEGEPASWKLKDMTDRDIWDVLESIAQAGNVRAVMERVNAMPRQGVSSTFKFGTSFGELKMGLVAARISFELVVPRKWQAALGCMSKGDKNVTKQKAEQLFPTTKITHANADSLLMAFFGRRFLK